MSEWAGYLEDVFNAVLVPLLPAYKLDQHDPDMVDVRRSWAAADRKRKLCHGELGDIKGQSWPQAFQDHSRARSLLLEKLGVSALSPEEVAREAMQITKSNPSNWSGLLGCREADMVYLHLFSHLLGIPSPIIPERCSVFCEAHAYPNILKSFQDILSGPSAVR
jgi:hypothetical protein